MSTGERGFKRLRFEFDFEGHSELTDGSIARFRIEVTNDADQQGWRELVVVPETGLTVFESSAFGSPATDELTAYPAGPIGQPLDERVAEFSVVRGKAPAVRSERDRASRRQSHGKRRRSQQRS